MNETEIMDKAIAKLAPEVSKQIVASDELKQEVAKTVEAMTKALVLEMKKEEDVRANEQGKFTDNYKKAFLSFIKAQSSIQTKDMVVEQAKILNVATNSQGGFLVPTQFLGEATRLSNLYGVARRNTTVVPFNGQKADFAIIGDVTVSEQVEMAIKAENTPIVSKVSISMKTLYTMVRWSNQIADWADGSIALFDILLNRAALAFAYAEDSRALVGSATFTGGILQNSAAFGSYVAVAGQSTGALLKNSSLIQLIKTVNAAALLNAKFYMSNAQFINFATEVDTQGRFIHDTNSVLSGKTLYGYPVEVTEVLPQNAGVTTKAVIFGDLKSSSYLFENQNGRSVALSQEATIAGESLFERNETAMRSEKYLDFVSFSNVDILNGSTAKSLAILTTSAT